MTRTQRWSNACIGYQRYRHGERPRLPCSHERRSLRHTSHDHSYPRFCISSATVPLVSMPHVARPVTAGALNDTGSSARCCISRSPHPQAIIEPRSDQPMRRYRWRCFSLLLPIPSLMCSDAKPSSSFIRVQCKLCRAERVVDVEHLQLARPHGRAELIAFARHEAAVTTPDARASNALPPAPPAIRHRRRRRRRLSAEISRDSQAMSSSRSDAARATCGAPTFRLAQ